MHPVTDDELRGLCAQAFNMAKLDLERGRFSWLLACYHGEGLHRMKKIEKDIDQRFGQGWLGSGRAKDLVFDAIRIMVKLSPPDAMVFASVANMFEVTELFRSLPNHEQEELLSSTHDAHHKAVKKGLLRCVDALTTMAQTPTRIVNQIQKMTPRGTPLEQPQVHIIDAADFDGRLKLYSQPDSVEFWKTHRKPAATQ